MLVYQWEIVNKHSYEAITGDKNFYTEIIFSMETLLEKHIDDYKESYARASNRRGESYFD